MTNKNHDTCVDPEELRERVILLKRRTGGLTPRGRENAESFYNGFHNATIDSVLSLISELTKK